MGEVFMETGKCSSQVDQSLNPKIAATDVGFGFFRTDCAVVRPKCLAMLASLDFFERLPAAGFAILHPVKVVSLRDLHPAGSLRFPLVAPERAASALRPPL